MAFRIHDSVVRGEIDNREKGFVRGRVWLQGRPEPLVLDLRGNAQPDLAGCLLRFTNPAAKALHGPLDSLNSEQAGTIGDLTASRKVRVFDIPFEQAYAMLNGGEKPPEHLANSLYLEWFSEANGRVVIESADYRLEISPPSWRLTPEEEAQRAQDAAAGFAGFMEKLSEALEAARFEPPEDRPMDEFEWEKAFRESDAVTEKAAELREKYGADPNFEEIFAREMGWTDRAAEDDDGPEEDEEPGEADGDESPENESDSSERKRFSGEAEAGDDGDEMDRICAEVPNPLTPNPVTEGSDWVREEDGDISHPLELRIRKGALAIWHWCDQRNLFGEQADPDVHQMVFKYQSCGAKCAGALGGLAYENDAREPGFIVARLKRALGLLHEAMAATERLSTRETFPAERLHEFRGELFNVREEILNLMERFRGEASSGVV